MRFLGGHTRLRRERHAVVAFTPASAIAAIFAATGQDLGMVGTSSMAQGTARRVEGGLQATIRFGGLEVGTVGGGTTLPSARDWLASIDCAGAGKVYRFARSSPPRRSASRSAPRRQWPRPAARTSSRRTTSAVAFVDACNSLLQASSAPPNANACACNSLLLAWWRLAMIALVFRYDARDPEEFEKAYGSNGEWAQFFREAWATSAPSSCATSKSTTATS